MKKYVSKMNIDEIFELLEKGHRILVEDCDGIYYELYKGITKTFIRVRPNDITLNPILTISSPKLYFEIEEPLEIKDAGLYKTKNGKQVYISLIYYDCNVSKVYCRGVLKNEDNIETWNKDGTYTDRNLNQFDIVSKLE